ncbi:unnamed protein product [Linum tenue]|uniref:Uncharacterized protein n=1 Tax=Linum tenue TaxID=586396 RepID=A0AAV0NRV3_9ROSI|nr:unnamed protein product [Linum tenue]
MREELPVAVAELSEARH